MIVGIPREIKNSENRVALTPAGIHALASQNHNVIVETGAGWGSGFDDEEYLQAGAEVTSDKASLFRRSDMIVKVKEPLDSEYDLLKPGQILFTYLHLAAEPQVAEALLKNKVTSIGYETVQSPDGTLPLLTPMSMVAGRMSVQVGAALLQKSHGGIGILLGGVPGVLPAEVVIIGGGVVGINAAKMAVGSGANVTVLDIDQKRLSYLDDVFNGKINTLHCNAYNVAQLCRKVDLLIGAVLIPGAKAPKIVSEEMVKSMKKGAVIIDVAIDQGGSVETADRTTTHDDPTFEKHGVIHYSVPNMPGAVPRTSTFALEAATLPYAILLANKGLDKALKEHGDLRMGVNTMGGKVTNRAVAASLGFEYAQI